MAAALLEVPMTEPVILVEHDRGVATVTLNRPHALNALSAELREAITETFRALQADRSVDVVILTGAGRAFCAGLDLKELGGETDAPGGLDAVDSRVMMEAVEAFDRPKIGAINGFAITGGFELALMCDFLIGSTEARFADTHVRVGIVPGWGLSQKLSRWIGVGRARELHYTGNYLSAEQAERWGLLNRAVAPDELLPVCMQLARDIQYCDQVVVREVKRIVDAGYATTLAEGLQIESSASRAHRESVTPARVAERRRAIQERGRAQSG
jgi:enoyl-CoA hydratase